MQKDALGRLTIDTKALRSNYRLLQDKVGAPVRVSAVVKANAYGLGAVHIAKYLKEEGCVDFFVANWQEGQKLRAAHPDINIMVLNGFYPDVGEIYLNDTLIPVLDSRDEITSYGALARKVGRQLPAMIHCNTGMNRLGMDMPLVHEIAGDPSMMAGIDLICVMSHLACADEKDHPLNEHQRAAFAEIAALFPNVPKALANSSGIFLGSEYHYDMVRPGMALYGLNPVPYADKNPMAPVITLDLPVICRRNAPSGAAIGYGAAHTFVQETCVATLSGGYADGVFRSLSNKGALYWRGVRCPIIGRISMDMLSVDLSAVPNEQRPEIGDRLELIGPHQSAADIGDLIEGSFDYEVLTSLSPRYERIYTH